MSVKDARTQQVVELKSVELVVIIEARLPIDGTGEDAEEILDNAMETLQGGGEAKIVSRKLLGTVEVGRG